MYLYLDAFPFSLSHEDAPEFFHAHSCVYIGYYVNACVSTPGCTHTLIVFI